MVKKRASGTSGLVLAATMLLASGLAIEVFHWARSQDPNVTPGSVLADLPYTDPDANNPILAIPTEQLPASLQEKRQILERQEADRQTSMTLPPDEAEPADQGEAQVLTGLLEDVMMNPLHDPPDLWIADVWHEYVNGALVRTYSGGTMGVPSKAEYRPSQSVPSNSAPTSENEGHGVVYVRTFAPDGTSIVSTNRYPVPGDLGVLDIIGKNGGTRLLLQAKDGRQVEFDLVLRTFIRR